MVKKNDRGMKKIWTLATISIVIFSLAVAYYRLIAIPKQKKEQELIEAKSMAITICQGMVERTRREYNKAVSATNQRAAGSGKMADGDLASIQQNWNLINTPQWFQSCILKNLEDWGYSGK